MAYQIISLEHFSSTFGSMAELSSVALGGKIVKVSDEFFAEAYHLLLVEPAPSLKGQYGPNGALYSGWETRRHNPTYDWCIIKLGSPGTIVGFDIDTSHFNGNEAPEVSVDALLSTDEDESGLRNAQWTEILPRVPLGPSARHLFSVPESSRYNYVKLNMYPDGGIARFRVYGHISLVLPADDSEPFDLAHIFAGGRVVFTSDQHFGTGSNIILPGRGKDMSDGWETKRNRQHDHKDWVIVRLGAPGRLQTAEIDTANFIGNFPESCELHAINSTSDIPDNDSADWVTILPRMKLGPHRRHFFQLEADQESLLTHVKLTIYPDGGIKRLRIIGTRGKYEGYTVPESRMEYASATTPIVQRATIGKVIPVLPLTPEAFAAFGQVIQAYGSHTTAPPGTKITPANRGTASKFHKLALLKSSYPESCGATAGVSVYRCDPVKVTGGMVELNVLERHKHTNQAFIPMGAGGFSWDEALREPGKIYLVVVALNGGDDKPDLSTLRAFVATAAQGIMYNTAVWHQPMTVLERAMDFSCVETQIGDGGNADCEIVDLDEALYLKLPEI
ncbi:galactose-binding domain-like protein [Pisolithus thermaeus]|nr:galactose-binding domain-like protein [Pisolithus thermaeus]